MTDPASSLSFSGFLHIKYGAGPVKPGNDKTAASRDECTRRVSIPKNRLPGSTVSFQRKYMLAPIPEHEVVMYAQ
jgi:hypothetical protein